MAYKSLMDCILDLEKQGQLRRIKQEVDPNLQMADIHLQTYADQGPALFFENVKGSPFKAVSNIFGTNDRTEYIFRKTIPKVQQVMQLKSDPMAFFKQPWTYRKAPFAAWTALPKKTWGKPPVLFAKTTIDQLPQIKSWPDDGGAFITLPQVLSLPPGSRSPMESNIGMYRIQLNGNDYIPNKEVGLHYQIHRGIGIHHAMYNHSKEAFRVSIFIGGPPAHTFSAIMPMPEGLSEMTFAGMLNGRRFRYFWKDGYLMSADADFVITGIIHKDKLKPEGPFGDHLGYYSLEHDFPVMEVEQVYHRKNAVWHFTVVGRPPQEDSSFGHLIHLLAGGAVQDEYPGIREVKAVDAAGVHPLLLAIGSERYMPFKRVNNKIDEKRPEEILTQANHLLGKGQTTLAKYLFIADGANEPHLSTNNIPMFFQHFLERVDWRHDVHFLTNTTMDTLDYSGGQWNAGSKAILACAGAKRRSLSDKLLQNLNLPDGFKQMEIALPGIIMMEGPKHQPDQRDIFQLVLNLSQELVVTFPLIIVVDDSRFAAKNVNNFLWTTFTRSDPAQDIYGVDSFTENKHWGCHGSLVIDARIKAHHAPELRR